MKNQGRKKRGVGESLGLGGMQLRTRSVRGQRDQTAFPGGWPTWFLFDSRFRNESLEVAEYTILREKKEGKKK